MVSEALTTVKELLGLVDKYKNADLYQKIVDLRDKVFTLSEENLQLKTDLSELRRQQEVSGELKRVGNWYEQTLPNGTNLGPYCLSCWDSQRKLVNLAHVPRAYGDSKFYCGNCKAHYDKVNPE